MCESRVASCRCGVTVQVSDLSSSSLGMRSFPFPLLASTDRLAFIFSQVGDLEQAHVKRSEEARSQLKAIQKAEQDLSVRRDKRIRIKQELLQLVPVRSSSSLFYSSRFIIWSRTR